jgi:LysM repeat protein
MMTRWMSLLGILFLASAVGAETGKLPQLLRIQGRFTDTKIPLTDNLPVRFSIWDTPDGYGNLLWVDVQTVSVQSDTFQVVLGRAKPLTPGVFSGGDRWVELQIGDDAPLRPRYKIPYQYIQAQMAAVQATPVPVPPPTAVAVPAQVTVVSISTPTLSDQEKRDLETQLDKYKESENKQAKPAKKKRPAATSKASASRGPVYEVQDGDTLKSIARKLYGNAELWYDLYYLNRDRLGPMGHLFPGQILVLPTQTPTGKQH